jgi:hypothetical protein
MGMVHPTEEFGRMRALTPSQAMEGNETNPFVKRQTQNVMIFRYISSYASRFTFYEATWLN